MSDMLYDVAAYGLLRREGLVLEGDPTAPIHQPAFVDPLTTTLRRKGAIPRALRWEVWERDDFTCQGCGSRRFLEVDHIHPESRGGQTALDNLQTLCGPCNRSKGAAV